MDTPTSRGWDPDFYEDDPDDAEKARIAAVMKHSTVVTGDEIDPETFYVRRELTPADYAEMADSYEKDPPRREEMVGEPYIRTNGGGDEIAPEPVRIVRDDAYYERLSAAIEAGDYVAGSIEYGPAYRQRLADDDQTSDG